MVKDYAEATEKPTRKLPPRMQDRLAHELLLPEEAQAIRAEVRSFAERELFPIAYDIGQREESVENFARDFFVKMGAKGLYKIPFSTVNGGRGLKYPASATAVAIEELAYFSNSVAGVYDVQCILAGHALEYGSEQIRQRYLVPLINGEKFGSFATTEPDASSDLSVQSLQTTAIKQGNKYIINGQKRWISNSPIADFVVVLCRTEDTTTEFVVDLHSDGVRVGVPDKKLGNRGQLTADIYLENVSVPEENIRRLWLYA